MSKYERSVKYERSQKAASVGGDRPPEVAEGRLKEAYDWQAQRLGEPTEYTQLGSLHPELVYERLRLYKVVDGLASGMSDVEKHIVVYLTSVLNETPHCASGARHKLGIDGVPDEQLQRVLAKPLRS